MLNQIAHAAGLLLLQICSRIVITFFHFNIVPVNGFNQVSFLSIFSPGLCRLGQFSPNHWKVDPKHNLERPLFIFRVCLKTYSYRLPALTSNRRGPNVSTTPITAMGCREFSPLSVVQLKGKRPGSILQSGYNC